MPAMPRIFKMKQNASSCESPNWNPNIPGQHPMPSTWDCCAGVHRSFPLRQFFHPPGPSANPSGHGTSWDHGSFHQVVWFMFRASFRETWLFVLCVVFVLLPSNTLTGKLKPAICNFDMKLDLWCDQHAMKGTVRPPPVALHQLLAAKSDLFIATIRVFLPKRPAKDSHMFSEETGAVRLVLPSTHLSDSEKLGISCKE